MRCLIIVCTFLHFTASAQSWCPPGAQWTYQYSAQLLSGVTHAYYSGDTILDGLPSQRIDHEIHAYQQNWPPLGDPGIWPQEPLFTHATDDVVFLWNTQNASFDTLMWFGAVPGDLWYMPHQDEFLFTVLDTGTSDVQGVPLRFLVLYNDMIGTDTLRERIGFDHHYIDPIASMFVDHTTFWLQCYDDILIIHFTGSNAWFDCDIVLGAEGETAHAFALYPNPGTSHFTLDLPPGQYQLRSFDALGRSVIHRTITSERSVIGTGSLPLGLYHIHVVDQEGRSWRRVWIKE